VIDLLKGYFEIGDRDDQDDHREMRARMLGRVLGLDRALEPLLPPLTALLGPDPGVAPLTQMLVKRGNDGRRDATEPGRRPFSGWRRP